MSFLLKYVGVRSSGQVPFYLILTLALLWPLLTACTLFNTQPKPLVKAPPKQQIYTVPEAGMSDLATLDPALAHDPASMSAVQMLFTGLVQYDDKLQIRPQLAASWAQSPDGLSWTFHLKPNLKFSDGTSLTSADVAYSLDRALQPTTQSTVAPIYLGLLKDSDQLLAGHVSTLIGDSILTPDPNTIQLVTRKKAAYFLAMLTFPCSFVVEKSLVSTYGSQFTAHLTQGGASGPFTLASYIRGKEVDFAPNAHYYGPKPQLQRVRFVFYRTASDAYLAYQAGKVDMAEVPLPALSTDKQRNDFHQVALSWINYYTMNYLTKPFDNIKIRQAFALAIDKQAIANNVWHNTVLPTNHIVPQGVPGYNTALTGPDGAGVSGNPTEAQTLLQQGLKQEGIASVTQLPPITLTYATGVSSFDQEAAAMIKMWKQVLHITVATDPVDYNTLLDKVTAATNNAQGIQMWGLTWVGEYPDPQDWLTLQFDNGVPNNNMNYGQNQSTDAAQQQRVQQQLEAADATFQTTTRLQSYQQAEQQLVNDVAWLPVEQVTDVFLRSPFIVGIVDNGQEAIPPDDWGRIYRVQ
jgi:oligopeptide transport system substrate-binding protein